jgi:hypothetical protein
MQEFAASIASPRRVWARNLSFVGEGGRRRRRRELWVTRFLGRKPRILGVLEIAQESSSKFG